MKSKLSLKVPGLVITLALLANLLVGITLAPAGVSASTNQMVFTPYSLPSNIGYFIGGAGTPSFSLGGQTTTSFNGTANSNPTVTAVTASADGNSIYAWDDIAKILYYSSNAGKSYTALAFNTGDIAPFAGNFVGLKASPKFATDGIVVLVTSAQVWLISGGLANAVSVAGDLSTKLEGGTITSMDVGSYYTNGVLAVYIGVSGGAGLYSNVLVFQSGGFTWSEVGSLKTPDFATDPQVIAVKLSPNYTSDAEIMAVYTLGGNTYLASNIAALGWNNSILPVCTLFAGTATSAIIASGTDYVANSTGTVLVGTAAGLTNNGLFIVKGRVGAGGTATAILGGNAPNGNIPVNSIAIQGTLATSSVVVSSPGTTALNITTAVTASTVTWNSSAPYRAPTGTGVTSLCYCGTGNAKLLAGSAGFINVGSFYSGDGGAINLSTDNGNTFNQIGLISVQTVSGAAGLASVSPTLVYPSDTNWLSQLMNNGGFCQSTDHGASWVRIFGKGWGSNNAGALLPARSLNYATNNTWVVTNGSNIWLRSTNGSTYSPFGSPVAVGSFNYIEDDEYYIVSAGADPPGIYFSTRPYVNATFTPAIANINSITRKSADATHMTFAVGSRAGTVYQSTDGAVSFTQVGSGTGPFSTSDRVRVSYSSDGTLYAFANLTATFTTGIYMWVPATSSWLNIAGVITYPITNWTIAGDGTAYAIVDNGANRVGYGIYRSLNYNAINPDGSSGASWYQINQINFPGGSTTVTANFPSSGYPGASGASYTASIAVVPSGPTNTLQIIEKTSTVAGSGYNSVVYSFVDSYTNGPVIISPLDNSVLTTNTSVTMNWTAMNGPAGGPTVSSTNYQVQVTASADFSGATSPVFDTAGAGIDTYIAGNTQSTVGVNPGGGTNALKAGTIYHWRVRAISPILSRWIVSSFTTATTKTALAVVADFDGDSKTDISVYRPSDGLWVVLKSGIGQAAVQQWGVTGDTQVAGDYDGDSKIDYAVYRPSNGLWIVLKSGTGIPLIQQWGTSGDTAVPGDYNGDGKTDFAVYRPSNGLWIVLNSGSGTPTIQQWGTAGDMPVPGDYDGDGRTDIAVYRPSNGLWIILNSGSVTPTIQQWGTSGDIPVPGDYNGDGKTDIAVYRPSNGLWIILPSGTGTPTVQQWGANGDTAVPGDYNGDGKTDMGVYRPTNGLWIILPSGAGTPIIQQWGIPDDVPVP